MLCHRGLALGMINPYAKFDISMSTCYEYMKGDRKCVKSGALGSYGSLKVTENCTIR